MYLCICGENKFHLCRLILGKNRGNHRRKKMWQGGQNNLPLSLPPQLKVWIYRVYPRDLFDDLEDTGSRLESRGKPLAFYDFPAIEAANCDVIIC